MDKKGSLIVAGSGIKSIAHITLETRAWIRSADLLLYCVADPATAIWLRKQNPRCTDLSGFYQDQQPRIQTYQNMAQYIMQEVRRGQQVCVVFYGHPGVFSLPPHLAIAMARAEGFPAAMLPGVSAEDCLFADIGFDPANSGCLSLESTEMLLCKRQLPTDMHVILWQPGNVGELHYQEKTHDNPNKQVLLEYLQQFYPAQHAIFIYQASPYPGCPAQIEYLPLAQLQQRSLGSISTLYLPPVSPPQIDKSMAEKLGIALESPIPENSEQTHNNSATDDAITLSAMTSHACPPAKQPLPGRSALTNLLENFALQPALLAVLQQQPTVIRLAMTLNQTEYQAICDASPSAVYQALYQSEAITSQTSNNLEKLEQSKPQQTSQMQISVSAQQFFYLLIAQTDLAAAYAEVTAQAQMSEQAAQLLEQWLQEQGQQCKPQELYACLTLQPHHFSIPTLNYVRKLIKMATYVAQGEKLPGSDWYDLMDIWLDISRNLRQHKHLQAAIPQPLVVRSE
ncbi:SAM-dependent methyltransferase [Candidatus Venteria ishoeyi]|uniref:SAM-dependent methyltransferase n=1 Tax=Candidatus Venteria ishoeyi TaxID=1899563 RepID=UPI0025A60ABC|nr:SAM-dependent methyltransferase [Candidatus Venteria ishoeyi]MDM8546638.1 SAM-dependent methyltransferase [Candidatus Venteria ishoeyi]